MLFEGTGQNRLESLCRRLLSTNLFPLATAYLHWWLSGNKWLETVDFNAARLSLSEYIDNEDSVAILLNLKVVSLMLFVNSVFESSLRSEIL